MPERTATEVVEELMDLFDRTDFGAVRDALENRASASSARETLGPFQRFLEESVDQEIVIDYRRQTKRVLMPGFPRLFTGWQGWLEHWREWFTAWGSVAGQRELTEIDDQRVVVCSTDRLVGRLSGIEVEGQPAGIWTVVNGKIKRIDSFDDRDSAIAAAREAD